MEMTKTTLPMRIRTQRAGAIGWTLGGIAVVLPLLASARSVSEPEQSALPPSTKARTVLYRQDTVSPPAVNYAEVLASVERKRTALAVAYQGARSTEAQRAVLDSARLLFISSIVAEIAPEWVGTTWGFYGTSQKPREGSIACGYFVTTLLRDAGLPIERVRLAQLASESIIKRLTTERHIHRYSSVPLSSFVDDVRSQGTGLSIVGLDCHVGFIATIDSTVLFIHSSYVSPRTVVIEPAERSIVLGASKYRVTGRLSDDDDLIRRWLLARRP